jgi:hypothetical protein
MAELVINISEKAKKLLDAYKQSTGIEDESRVVEECFYTIYELLKLAKERSKTEPTIPADAFLGIVSTFQRFGEVKVEFEY